MRKEGKIEFEVEKIFPEFKEFGEKFKGNNLYTFFNKLAMWLKYHGIKKVILQILYFCLISIYHFIKIW